MRERTHRRVEDHRNPGRRVSERLGPCSMDFGSKPKYTRTRPETVRDEGGVDLSVCCGVEESDACTSSHVYARVRVYVCVVYERRSTFLGRLRNRVEHESLEIFGSPGVRPKANTVLPPPSADDVSGVTLGWDGTGSAWRSRLRETR